MVSFAISNKLVKSKTRSIKDFEKEWKKAASEKDFFIEFGFHYSFTAKDLPNERCGCVDVTNFEDYFGPFAGRAFLVKSKLQNN